MIKKKHKGHYYECGLCNRGKYMVKRNGAVEVIWCPKCKRKIMHERRNDPA